MSKATDKILTGARHWQTFLWHTNKRTTKLRDYYLLNLKKKFNENKLVLYNKLFFVLVHLRIKSGLANIFFKIQLKSLADSSVYEKDLWIKFKRRICSRQYKKLLLIESHFDTRSTHNLRGYLHFTVWKLSYYYASYNQFSYPWCIPNYQHHSARDSRRLSVSVEWCERTYLSNNYNGNHRECKLIFHIRYFLYKSHILSCYIKKDNLITFIMIWILLKYFDVSMLPEIRKGDWCSLLYREKLSETWIFTF